MMKNITTLIILSIFLVLGIGFFLFNTWSYNLAGFAVYNESSGNITKEMALSAILDSEKIINEMQENNFSADYMNDSLIEARRIFEQARYAEILRKNNSTEKEKQEAEDALKLIKWQNITYRDVLAYTEGIKKRRESAFLLLDKISIEKKRANESSEASKAIFERAKTAFLEERYNDAEKLLEDFKAQFEKEKAQNSTLAGLKQGAMNFFQRYWAYILAILIILSAGGYFIYKKFEEKKLRNKIIKIRTEEKVLIGLMKKAQTERFKENKISGLVYNIRMKKYEERMQEIKEELPVLENRLKRFLK